MKFLFALFPTFLALGFLGAIAPSASAQSADEYDVPMVSLEIPSVCTAVPIFGRLAADGSQTLSSTADGGSAGLLTVTCNVASSLSIDSDVEVIGSGETVGGVSINGATAFNTATAVTELSESNLSEGITAVDVDLTISTTEDVIQPGFYGFTVPVTLTYN